MEERVNLDLSDGQQMLSEWGFANHLTLFNTQLKKSMKSSKGSDLVDYKCVKSNIYSNGNSRSLLSESMSVFKSLQRMSTKCEPLSRNELIKGSRRYRSVIHSCFFNLINSPETETTLVLSNMFCQMEIVWNLCEILFIDIQSTGFLLNQLLVWIKWHFTKTNQLANSVMNAEMPSIDPNYWNVIISYVLRGETENARLLLELHSNANERQEFIALRDLLKKMPIISNNYLLHEFYLRWQSWREECEQTLNDGIFDVNPKLELIARLLIGDIEAFKSVLNLFESWYHLMVSYLLYTDPCIKENNLSDLCREFIALYAIKDQNESSPTPLDGVLTAAFSLDLTQVIVESNECFDDNWWFATHFVDLLYNANQLDLHQIDFPSKFRDFFVIEYSNSLITFDGLWQFGIDYLCHCLDSGLHYIELNLQRIAIKDETSAHKVIHLTNKLGLTHISRSVFKVLSRQWLSKGRLGSALFWAIRSEDSALTNHISDLFLIEYNKTGEFPDEDILSNSGRFMLISDRLTFLAKYYEFHQLLKENQLQSAAQLLVSLLISNIAPKFFIIRLLMDSLPLLETQNIVFDSEQTTQLMASLEEILSLANTSKELDLDIEYLKERENILRLAMARNLGRNFIFQ